MMITHDTEKQMFLIEKEEGLCSMEYTLADRTVTVTHTNVPDALSGQGLASQLAQALYDWTQKKGYGLLSDCTYMTHWLSKKK